MNEIATQDDLTPQKIFEQKIRERIIGDMGDLMPDEMVRGAIEVAIGDILYRDTNKGGYKSKPFIVEAVNDKVSEFLRVEVDKQLREREGEMVKLIEGAIRDSIPSILAAIIATILQQQTYNMEDKVRSMLNGQGY